MVAKMLLDLKLQWVSDLSRNPRRFIGQRYVMKTLFSLCSYRFDLFARFFLLNFLNSGLNFT